MARAYLAFDELGMNWQKLSLLRADFARADKASAEPARAKFARSWLPVVESARLWLARVNTPAFFIWFQVRLNLKRNMTKLDGD